MKIHKNARLTPKGREILVCRIVNEGLRVEEAAQASGVSVRTAYKWLARYRAQGREGLRDGSSRPVNCPHRTSQAQRAAILTLRRARCTYREISRRTGVAHSTVGRKVSDLRQGGNIERHLYPAAARPRELQEQRQKDGCEPAGVHPVPQKTAGKVQGVLGKYQIALEGDSDKERDTDNHTFAIVDSVLEDYFNADYEERRQHYGKVRRKDRAWYRQNCGEDFRKERHNNEHGPGGDPDAAGADSGDFGHRYAERVGRVRHCSRKTGDQVAYAVHGYRAFHRSEIRCPAPAPRYALDGDGAADRSDGTDYGNEEESGKKRPESRPEIEIEARPCVPRQANPRSRSDAIDIV